MKPREQDKPGSATVRDQIAALVEYNRALWKRLIVVEGLGLTLAAVVGYFLLALLLDNALLLPVFGRLVAVCGLVLCMVALGVRLVRRWRRRQLSEDEIALAIERGSPEGIQNRLINALQIGRDNGAEDNAFHELVVKDNWQQLQSTKLAHARAMRPAIIRVAAAAMMILAGILFWALRPDGFTSSAKRILMPFAVIDPRYQTVLVIKPGDAEVTEQLTITIDIHGAHPSHLTILRNIAGKRTSEKLALAADQATAEFTFPVTHRSFDYAVQGGDYTSRFFQATVAQPSNLNELEGIYHFPQYTGLPDRPFQSTNGNLNVLRGTRADITFSFDQKSRAAALVVAAGNTAERRIALERKSSKAFAGTVTFDTTMTCRVETETTQASLGHGATLVWRALPDKAPGLELTGLESQTEAAIDVSLPLTILATDDYGLREVGLFTRNAVPSLDAPTDDDTWKTLQMWPLSATGEPALTLQKELTLSMLRLGAAEGDHIEIALRARDHDPDKGDDWTDGTIYTIMVGGEGVALQLQYEQILHTEAAIASLIDKQRDGIANATEWLNKFRQRSGVRWDDDLILAALAHAMTEQAAAEDGMRIDAGRIARAIPEEVGTLRLSVAMLADTEFVRAMRILETVAERETPQAKRAVLGDARLTEERIVDSLVEILDQFRIYRQSWELAHMVPFLKMIADRQAKLAKNSERLAAIDDNDEDVRKVQQESGTRRQTKLIELIDLSNVAFLALSHYTRISDELIADAFAATANALQSEALRTSMQEASRDAGSGNWASAETAQNGAAVALGAIYERLRNAQKEAAKRALEALAAQESIAETQAALDDLLAGNLQSLLDKGAEDISMAEIIRIHEMAEANRKKHQLDMDDTTFPDYAGAGAHAMAIVKPPPPDLLDLLTLAKTPSGQMSFPQSSDLEGNKMALALIEGEFKDLVGDLLDEADDMREKFETYNRSMQGQGVEDGNIGKQGGDVNSVSAAAATGNMKPPTQNYGGASRSGRKGARSHGMVVGDESVNRRGRDEALDGQERAPLQPGMLKETLSADPQQDTSTGIGGKRVDSDDTSFSLKSSGTFDDETIKTMGKAQDKHKIVERMDGKIDAEVAAMMQDLNSDTEQIIERLKILRKELRTVYLPTRHLDGLLAELTANLDALKERPDPEAFKRQMYLIDQVRVALRVFRRPGSGLEPSLPRRQIVRGRVLDEPARPPLPGYEDAVSEYYQLLTKDRD